MPVFDFTHTPDAGKAPECTYTIFQSNEKNPTVDKKHWRKEAAIFRSD